MNYFSDIEGKRILNLPVFPTPKAVAIDLDGTLLDSQTRLSSRSRSALESCLEPGIPAIIATSRPARHKPACRPPSCVFPVKIIRMSTG
jgi:hypothetical protein